MRIATRPRAAASSFSASESSVRIATAPRATASPAKARPSREAPRKAANRKPGSTRRESAVIPVISGLPAPGLPAAGLPEKVCNTDPGLPAALVSSISSIRVNPLSLQAFDRQRPDHLRRCLVNRLHAEYRRNALHEAARRRHDGPTGRRKPMACLGTVRLVDKHEDRE